MHHGIDAFEPVIGLILRKTVNVQLRLTLSLLGRGNANESANRNPSGSKSSLNDRANGCAHRVNGHGDRLSAPQSASGYCGFRVDEDVHGVSLRERHRGYGSDRVLYARVNANDHPCDLNASRKVVMNEHGNACGLPRVHGRNDRRKEHVSDHGSANDRPIRENVSDAPKVRGPY